MRRLLLIAPVALLLAATPASRADAKTGFFEVAVTHEATQSDHAVTVTATMADTTAIVPTTVGIYLRSDLDAQYHAKPDAAPAQVQLTRVDGVTVRGVTLLPKDGEWVVVPFADITENGYSPLERADDYPIIAFTVPWNGTTNRVRKPSSSSSPLVPIGIVVVGGGVAAAAALGAFRLVDRRRATATVAAQSEPGAEAEAP